MSDIDCIREHIATYSGVKLGFTIYRLTYSDDAQWARFMHHLNTRVRLNLEEQGNGDVFPYIGWDVQEDPELEDADEETVRERFKSHASQHPHLKFCGPRFEACVAVTQDGVNTILEGPGPECFEIDATGFLTMIALDEEDGAQAVGFLLLFPRVY